MNAWLLILIGYVVSCGLGHVIAGPFVNKLWRITNVDLTSKGIDISLPLRPVPLVSFCHGVAERAVYTTSILLGKPEGIAVWLAFKGLMRFKVKEDDLRHAPASPIYMIGTAINLAFGVLGGLIAVGKTTL